MIDASAKAVCENCETMKNTMESSYYIGINLDMFVKQLVDTILRFVSNLSS